MNVQVLAVRYNAGIAMSTAAIFLTTAVAMATLSGVLFLLFTFS